MLVWKKGILIKQSLCYSIVFCYNGAQWYKQFLRVSQLYRALILLGLALCLPSASVSLVCFVVLQVHIFNFFITFLTLLLICDAVHNSAIQIRIAWLYCTHVFMSLLYVHRRSRK